MLHSCQIFEGIQKTFDIVDENILKQLELYRIRATYNKWLVSYFSNRKTKENKGLHAQPGSQLVLFEIDLKLFVHCDFYEIFFF